MYQDAARLQDRVTIPMIERCKCPHAGPRCCEVQPGPGQGSTSPDEALRGAAPSNDRSIFVDDDHRPIHGAGKHVAEQTFELQVVEPELSSKIWHRLSV